jgi:hypothetical protein
MPWLAHEFDSDFVNCATPPFAAAYAGTLSPPWKDTKDAISRVVSTNFDKKFPIGYSH